MNLKLENIRFYYPLQPERIIFSGLNLEINNNEIVGIIGNTGAGKTTLLQLCSGLLQPTDGYVRINGEILDRPEKWRSVRKKIGVVFQFPEKQLFEETVYEDVAFGIKSFFSEKSSVEGRVENALKSVGLDPEFFIKRSPHRLSSGEKRKVALAGIIAFQPELLLLDEPTIGIDHKGILEIEEILSEFRSGGRQICLVSHNLEFVTRLADRIIVLDKGEICYDGAKKELFSDDTLLNRLGIDKPDILILRSELSEKYGIDLSNSFRYKEIISLLRKNIGSNAV